MVFFCPREEVKGTQVPKDEWNPDRQKEGSKVFLHQDGPGVVNEHVCSNSGSAAHQPGDRKQFTNDLVTQFSHL